jgi:hypothetical protein
VKFPRGGENIIVSHTISVSGWAHSWRVIEERDDLAFLRDKVMSGTPYISATHLIYPLAVHTSFTALPLPYKTIKVGGL